MERIVERVIKTTTIPAGLLTEKPPFPKKVKIEITSRCDLNCFFCSHTYKKVKRGNIDKEFLFRILREFKTLGVEDVGLFWLGESLLVKELPEYVAFAKEIGIDYVFITTNGRLTTMDRIKELFDSGLDSIKFSVNAGNRERYYKMCGVDAFDQVISNIIAAYKYRGNRKKPAIYASTIYDPANRIDYDSVKKLIGPYVDQHYPLQIYGKYTFPFDKGSDLSIDYIENKNSRMLSSMLPCWSLFTEPHISFDGFMSACFCDHDEKYYMGNLNMISPMEAWHSKKFVELRRLHLKKNVTGSVCEGCIAYNRET